MRDGDGQHAHEWAALPALEVGGARVQVDICDCHAWRGRIEGLAEELVIPAAGLPSAEVARASGVLIGTWAVATLKRRRQNAQV